MHQSSTLPHSEVLSTPLQEAATPAAGTAPQIPSPFPQPALFVGWSCNLHHRHFTFKLLHQQARQHTLVSAIPATLNTFFTPYTRGNRTS